jgi:hypothetical protein
MKRRRLGTALLVLLAAVCGATLARAQTPPAPAELTPPRLSFTDGPVSFRRAGGEDWSPAQVNTPLAPGDQLYTGERANFETQVGTRAFVRAAERTQLGLVNLEPDYLQLKLTAGTAALDLRVVPAGHTFELDTPNGVLTIERPGYYRAEIVDDTLHVITHRGGLATLTTVGGRAQTISPSEEVVVRGTSAPTVETYVAPELDAWDRWNYARTDAAAEALSGRYVSPGVYGLDALDRYGTWRVVPTYGAVWVPDGLAAGWAPYSTGSWIWDPRYGWTWVDAAPWGWAPFHYGRWVFVDGIWAWTPGPVIVRPVYAPALVAFFTVGANVSVRVGINAPAVGWVALGWGEPLRPWWGRPGFIGRPWWGGWGGPRVVNNVVVSHTTVVNVNTIVYQNTRVPHSVRAVGDAHFGKGPIRGASFTTIQPHELARVGGALPVRPGPASVAPASGSAARPPEAMLSRRVVSTRAPREQRLPWQTQARAREPAAPAPQLVTRPKPPAASVPLSRPTFGTNGPERARPPAAPRFEETRPATPPAARVPESRPVAPSTAPPPGAPPRAAGPPPARPAPQAEVRRESPGVQQRSVAPPAAQPAPSGPGARREGQPGEERRALPGRPANELFPRGGEQRSGGRGDR